MRLLKLSCCVVILLLACQEVPDQRLCGTWRMVSGAYKSPDWTIREDENSRMCYKILSQKHFTVIELYPQNPDSLFFAAFGTFELTDTSYVEHYEGSNIPGKIGTSLHFRSKVDGGKWRIFLNTEELKLDETWIRVCTP